MVVRSKVPTQEYKDNWDKIFGGGEFTPPPPQDAVDPDDNAFSSKDAHGPCQQS